MGRREIGGLTRDYVFDVLWWPRKDDGSPDFGGEDGGPDEVMRRRAERVGIPHRMSAAFARRMLARRQR